MHQPVSCGTYRNKLEQLKDKLVQIEALFAYCDGFTLGDHGKFVLSQAKTALEDIRKDLS